jgi:t-SNARE complex subunit (syntaxin)
MTKELNWKERKMLFLEERLNEIEKELHSLPHKIYDLEHRRKSILKRMEELDSSSLDESLDNMADDKVHQQLFGI